MNSLEHPASPAKATGARESLASRQEGELRQAPSSPRPKTAFIAPDVKVVASPKGEPEYDDSSSEFKDADDDMSMELEEAPDLPPSHLDFPDSPVGGRRDLQTSNQSDVSSARGQTPNLTDKLFKPRFTLQQSMPDVRIMHGRASRMQKSHSMHGLVEPSRPPLLRPKSKSLQYKRASTLSHTGVNMVSAIYSEKGRSLSSNRYRSGSTAKRGDASKMCSVKLGNKQAVKRFFGDELERTYTAHKQDKLKRWQKRKFVIDTRQQTLRTVDPKKGSKKVHRAAAVEQIQNKGNAKVTIRFESNRQYRLKFETTNIAMDFCQTLQKLIELDKTLEEQRTLEPGLSSGGNSIATPKLGTLSKAGTARSPRQWQNSGSSREEKLDPDDDAEVEDTTVAFQVTKLDKFKNEQSRIFLIDQLHRKCRVLNDKGSVRKEFSVTDVQQLEFWEPSAETILTKDARKLHLVFHQQKKQRPFFVFFESMIDRDHFLEHLTSMNQKILMIDLERDADGDHAGPILRFACTGKSRKQRLSAQLNSKTSTLCIIEANQKNTTKRVVDVKQIKQVRPKKLSASWNRHQLQLDFFDGSRRDIFFHTLRQRSQFVTKLQNLCESSWVAMKEDPGPPQDDYQLFCGTWNIGESKPTAKSFEWVPQDLDIYIVGFQEFAHIGKWQAALLKHLKIFGNYSMLSSQKMWQMIVLVFVKQEHIHKVSEIDTGYIQTGIKNVIGNKGAVAVKFNFYETSICAIVCHLAARTERIGRREQDFHRIMKEIKLGDTFVDLIHNFDHIFFMGDLNYRIANEFEKVVAWIKERKWEHLQNFDQLKLEMESGRTQRVLQGFKEGQLNFPPSYRMLREELGYSNKRGQAPSWTDRILYQSLPQAEQRVIQQSYSSSNTTLGSDHRPVYALFQLTPVRLPPLTTYDLLDESITIKISNITFTMSKAQQLNEEDTVEIIGKHFYAPTHIQAALRFKGKPPKWICGSALGFDTFCTDEDFVSDTHARFAVLNKSSGQRIGGAVIPMTTGDFAVEVLNFTGSDEALHVNRGTIRGIVKFERQVKKDKEKKSPLPSPKPSPKPVVDLM